MCLLLREAVLMQRASCYYGGLMDNKSFENWLEKASVIKGYAHFDERVALKSIISRISQPSYIEHHAFKPFIHYSQIFEKFSKQERKEKIRELNSYIEELKTDFCVSTNEGAVLQVLINLIDNAIKFSEPNSSIDIKAFEKGDKLTFSVRNYGAEIPEEQLKYVFDRFHKADSSRSKDKSGLGLGLYIAKTIINQHKGKIWAVSENGYTEFSFTVSIRRYTQG